MAYVIIFSALLGDIKPEILKDKILSEKNDYRVLSMLIEEKNEKVFLEFVKCLNENFNFKNVSEENI